MLRHMCVKWRRLLVATAGAVCLVACSDGAPSAPSAGSEEADAGLTEVLTGGLDERAQVPAPLQDTDWRVVTVVRGAQTKNVEALQSSLRFGVDSVSGKTCYGYGARVSKVIGDRITTDGVDATQMGCVGPTGEMDGVVQSLLLSGFTWQRQDAALTLAGGGITLLLALHPA